MTSLETKLKDSIAMLTLAEGSAAEFRKQTATIWLDCIREKYGIEEGVTVVRYKKQLYRVCTIERTFGWEIGKPALKGNQKNKDGSWSIGERNLWLDWEVMG